IPGLLGLAGNAIGGGIGGALNAAGSGLSMAGMVAGALGGPVGAVLGLPAAALGKLLSFQTAFGGFLAGQGVEGLVAGPISFADEMTRMQLSTEGLFRSRQLGSPADAAAFVRRIQSAAIELPGSAQDLMESARTLLAYGFTPEQIAPFGANARNPG